LWELTTQRQTDTGKDKPENGDTILVFRDRTQLGGTNRFLRFLGSLEFLEFLKSEHQPHEPQEHRNPRNPLEPPKKNGGRRRRSAFPPNDSPTGVELFIYL
jgi:hypothetical protein